MQDTTKRDVEGDWLSLIGWSLTSRDPSLKLSWIFAYVLKDMDVPQSIFQGAKCLFKTKKLIASFNHHQQNTKTFNIPQKA